MPTRRAREKVWPLFRGIVVTSSTVLSQFTLTELETILRFLELNRTALRVQVDKTGEL